MARPADLPDWATNANYGAGGRPWNGQPNKNKPSAGQIAEGFDPENPLFADFLNWLENNHGNWIGQFDSIFTNHAFSFLDDFMGGVVDTGLWVVGTSPTVADDSANGAIGALHCASASTQTLVSQFLALGTNDFALAFRTRTNATLTTQTVSFGFEDGGGASGVLLTGTSAGWIVSYDDLAHTFSTGLLTTSRAYHNWRILRYNGTQYIYLDGTLLNSVADVYNYSSAQRLVITSIGSGTSPDVYVDYFKFWVGR